VTADRTDQAERLGAAIAILERMSGNPLPLMVSQSLGPHALATMMRIAHQPQNAARRAELEDALTEVLSGLSPDWLNRSPVLPQEDQAAAWLGFYGWRAEHPA
jgi:hypothetical protein